MALIQFTYEDKEGKTVEELLYSPTSSFEVPLEKVGGWSMVKRFKYKHTHHYGPALTINQKGEKVLLPSWTVVHPKTTLDDIKHVRPKEKTVRTKVETFETASKSSPDITYVTKRYTKGDEVSFSCNCPGQRMSKARECKHIKSLK